MAAESVSPRGNTLSVTRFFLLVVPNWGNDLIVPDAAFLGTASRVACRAGGGPGYILRRAGPNVQRFSKVDNVKMKKDYDPELFIKGSRPQAQPEKNCVSRKLLMNRLISF
jgi:hypothetical protein